MRESIPARTPRAEGSVAARFSRAATTYDGHARVQRAVARRVAELVMTVPPPERVVEIGCGTGILTEQLLEMLPRSTIHALDVAGGMIERARLRLGGTGRIVWDVGDAGRAMDAGPFDLAVSSSALHWMGSLAGAFSAIRRLLGPTGHLVAGMMLDGTLAELRQCRLLVAPHKPPRGRLPSEGEVRAALRRGGLRLLRSERRRFREIHPSAAGLIRALHEQGVTGGDVSASRAPLSRGELLRLVECYEARFGCGDGGVAATFEVLYLVARREGG